MQAHCGNPDSIKGRLCISDELFVSTLLSAYNLQNGADGIGFITYVQWTGGWHPLTFYPDDFPVSEAITKMRTDSGRPGYVPGLHACLTSSVLRQHAEALLLSNTIATATTFACRGAAGVMNAPCPFCSSAQRLLCTRASPRAKCAGHCTEMTASAVMHTYQHITGQVESRRSRWATWRTSRSRTGLQAPTCAPQMSL